MREQAWECFVAIMLLIALQKKVLIDRLQTVAVLQGENGESHATAPTAATARWAPVLGEVFGGRQRALVRSRQITPTWAVYLQMTPG